MALAAVRCPSCKIAPASDSTLCPDCGEDLSALIQLQRRSSILYNEALRFALARDSAAATERLHLALREDPSDVDILLLLGKLHARSGRDEDARAAWEAALRHAPADPRLTQAMDALEERTAETARRTKQAEEEQQAREAVLTETARRRERRAQMSSFAAGVAALGIAVSAWMGWNRQPAAVVDPSVAAGISAQVAAATPDPAVNVASAAVGLALPADSARPAAATDDATLAARVEEALQRQPALTRLPLSIKIQDGTVVVDGKTSGLLERYLVESTVRSVPGVKFVDLRNLALDDAYVVRAGDTLSSIAVRRYGSSSHWRVVALSNGIESPYLLRIGQRLSLP